MKSSTLNGQGLNLPTVERFRPFRRKHWNNVNTVASLTGHALCIIRPVMGPRLSDSSTRRATIDSLPRLKFLFNLTVHSLRTQPTFGNATTGFPAKWRLRNERRNSILMTRHYPDLGSASDWSCRVGNLIQPIRSTTQIWVVTRHQYGISALLSQTSFGGETSGNVAKCRLFSLAKQYRICPTIVELNLGATHDASSESDVAPVSLSYSVRFGTWKVQRLNQP